MGSGTGIGTEKFYGRRYQGSKIVDSVGHGKKDDHGYRNGVEILLMLNSAIYSEEGVEGVSGGAA